MATVTDRGSRALSGGLLIRRPRRRRWTWAIIVVMLGILAAGLVAETSTSVVLGTIAVLVAIGATMYRLALGLAVLAFIYPFDLMTYAGPVKLTTSAALMAVLVVVWLWRFMWIDGRHWHSAPLDVPVLVFACATLLSVLGLAGHWEDQMVGLLKALGGFVVFFVATQAIRTRVDLLMVVSAVLATASVQTAALTAHVLAGSVIVSEDVRATGTVDDPNLFAGYLVLVTPLALAVGISFRHWWTTVLTAGVMMALIIALVATLSRSGWIGAVVGVLILTVVLPERRWLIAGLGAAIAVAALLILFTPIAMRISPHGTGPAEMLASRVDIWMVALSTSAHHPLVGVGVANFVNYYPQYGGAVQGINHAHDIFLNMLVERGVIGLLAFTAVLILLFKSLANSLRTVQSAFDRAMVAGLIGSFGGYLVHSLVEVSYYDYKVLLLFWLLGGVAAVISQASNRSATASVRIPASLSARRSA